jgi:hypothetical protein
MERSSVAEVARELDDAAEVVKDVMTKLFSDKLLWDYVDQEMMTRRNNYPWLPLSPDFCNRNARRFPEFTGN